MDLKKKGEIVLVLGVFLAIGMFLFLKQGGGATGLAVGILPDLGENSESVTTNESVVLVKHVEEVIEPEPVSNEEQGMPAQPNNFIQEAEIQGAASATSCGEVTTSLTLTSDVSSGGSCFNISANSVTVNCAGRRITYGSAGMGGYAINNTLGYDNIGIKNCEIVEGSAAGDSQFAIYMVNALNITVENNTINTSGTSGHAIFFNTSNVLTLHLNTITTTGSNGYGLHLSGVNSSKILSNDITTSGSTGYALYLTNFSGNNTFTNNRFSSGTAFEILDESGDNIVNYLIYNDTFGEIKWLDNGTSSFLQNLTLNGTIGPTTNIYIDYNIIAVNTSAFSPLRINSTVSNITFYKISLGTATQMLKDHGFSTSNADIRNTGINCNATSCPITRYLNSTGVLLANTTSLGSFTVNGEFGCNNNLTRDFYFDRNVSALLVGGACFNITSTNITFDCRSYSIIGNATGTAISHNESFNLQQITIKRCLISNFTIGIETFANWTIIDSTIFNISSVGINIPRIQNKIINNTIHGNILGIDSDANSLTQIANNTFYLNDIAIRAQEVNSTFQDNNFSHNIIGVQIDCQDCIFEHNFFWNNTAGYNIRGFHYGAGTQRNSFISDRFISNGNATYINGTSDQDLYQDNTFLHTYFLNNKLDINVINFFTFNHTVINSSTLNRNKVIVPTNGYIYFKSIVDVNVTDITKTALVDATARAIDSVGEENTVNVTNVDGMSRLYILELFRTNNVNYYVTPTTIRVNRNNYTQNSTTINLVNVSYVLVNLSITPVTCGSIITSNFDFGNNYSCPSDGLTILSSAVVINGNNFSITGQNSGTGLILNETNWVNITNLRIANFRVGIHMINTNDSKATDVEVLNMNRGVIFNNSHNNYIYDSTIGNNSEFSIYGIGERTTNNSIVNVSIDIVNITVDTDNVIRYKWRVIVNATFNGNNPLPSATVQGRFNRTGVLDDTVTTKSNGIGTLALTEVLINSSGRTYVTPHNITLVFNYKGTNITNETTKNISINNNTLVNLSVVLDCTAPSSIMAINSHTTFCPGTYSVEQINITANHLNITCVQTILSNSLPRFTQARIFYVATQNVTINGCFLKDGYYGIEAIDSNSRNTYVNLTIKNSLLYGIIGGGREVIDNVTFDGSGSSGSYGILAGSFTTIKKSTFSNLYIGVYLVNTNNTIISNNTFSSVGIGIMIDTPTETLFSGNNSIYYNTFLGSTTYHFQDVAGTGRDNYFNTTSGILTQGNQYHDYCDKGVDTNGDDYADNTTSGAADWPYNTTIAGGKIFEGGGGAITDYGPRIISCPPSSVQLGSSSSSGGSSRAAAAASSPSVPAPAETGGTRETPPPPPPPEETYSSASEAAEFLERQVTTQDLYEKNIKVTIVLENTGTKKMLLFPEIFQKVGDPFFIVTRKTLGFEGSLFTKLSALSYSRDPVAGRLLKATIVNPEQIILNPGEKIEKVIEIDEGLPIPREIKIQFTTLGETVFEEKVTVKQKALSGTALDIDKEHQYLDIYAVIVPEELTKELEQYYAGSPTAGAISDYKTAKEKRAAFKGNMVGFAQRMVQQITTPTQENVYQLELGLYEPGSSEAFFTDLYGPYELKENQTFVFAQQLKYNPEIYNGNYQLRTKIYRGGSLLVKNQFDVNLGEEKRGMLWPWIAVQSALILVGGMLYFMSRSNRKSPSVKKDL